jgi:hypothetical protein
MNWFKRIVGALIALQCIGFFHKSYANYSLYLQGWSTLGKAIFMGIIGAVLLGGGLYLIKSSFKVKK